MKTTNLKIKGMTCGGCVATIRRMLGSVPGVSDVRVDLPGGRATVVHDDQTHDERLLSAVEYAGFGATVERI